MKTKRLQWRITSGSSLLSSLRNSRRWCRRHGRAAMYTTTRRKLADKQRHLAKFVKHDTYLYSVVSVQTLASLVPRVPLPLLDHEGLLYVPYYNPEMRTRERKGKEEYSAFSHQGTYKALRHGSHSFTCKQHHTCLSFVAFIRCHHHSN